MKATRGADGKYHFVYMTLNKVTNKLYLGKHSTKRLNDNYLGSGKLLLQSIKKYGRENFIIDIINFYDTSEQAYKMEKLLSEAIDVVNDDNFYNLIYGGKHSLSGYNMPEEKRKLLSEKYKGTGNPFYGRHHTEETKKRISMMNKGTKYEDPKYRKRLSELRRKENLSEETIRKKREAVMGSKNPFYGKHHTEETKEKIRKKVLGRKLPEEVKAKITKTTIFRKKSECPKCGKVIGGGDYNFKRHLMACGKNVKNRVYELTTCPYCGKIGGKNTMKRWHFNNCKFKNSTNNENISN